MKNKLSRAGIIAFLLLLFLVIHPALSFSQKECFSEITSFCSDTDLTNASWSISVLDIKKDSVIIEHNSKLTLIPASATKIITTATALALLGWDFKYETRIEYDGTLDSLTGILYGNIYIIGSGDPTLDSEAFKIPSEKISLTEQWAKIISEKGIKKIKGAIIADASVFEEEMVPSTWIWGDMGNYYGAGACGLNFKDNQFSIYYKSGNKKDDPISITKIHPQIPGLKIENYARTGYYVDNAYIYGAPYDNFRYVRGTIPQNKSNFEVKGSIPDPPLFCAQSLDSSLRKLGIEISNIPTTVRVIQEKAITPHSKSRTLLHTETSHTLEKIIYQTNMQSNNLYAEALLKTIALKKARAGDDQTGTDIVTDYWKQKDIDLKGFYMADGSGLSRFNSITTKQLSSILRAIAQDSILYKRFSESLPVAGKSGSLGRLCKGTRAEGNLSAKSGYMTRVRSYAGYVTSKKGDLLSFAIIVNNYTCTPTRMKDELEKMMIAIAEIE